MLASGFIILQWAASTVAITVPSEIPAGWDNTTIKISFAERTALARDALEQAYGQMLNSKAGMTESAIYSEMAEFDLLTRQTLFKDRLISKLNRTQDNGDTFLSKKSYGYVALRAYAAYEEDFFLEKAQEAWDWSAKYTLNSNGLQNTTRNLSIPRSCSNHNLTGGTFNTANDINGSVLGQATLWSFLTSSLFAESLMTNQTYFDLAQQTYLLIRNQFVTDDFTVQGGIDVKTCNGTNNIVPMNSGLTIEGATALSILQPSNSFNESLINLVSGAISKAEWHFGNGILRSGGYQGAGSMVRALAIWHKTASASALQKVVEGYISIQYNAVLGKAKDPQGNIYGSSWIGPSSRDYQADAQASAISVLLAGIRLGDSNGKALTNSASSPTKLSVGAIVGVVLGSVFGTVCLAMLVSYIRQRQVRRTMALMPGPFLVGLHQVNESRSCDRGVDQSKRAGHPNEEMERLSGAMNQIIALLRQRTDLEHSAQSTDRPPSYSEHRYC
ncbi:hypothetical protein VNI00_019253 [Paramarasmius palmivorus]|uniref:Glycoside hydrolase family 76 protein n=1 Tax=Paramarasmius palmivorus TaxID=297713 RepID=A0AAW0APJ6_9AGAR